MCRSTSALSSFQNNRVLHFIRTFSVMVLFAAAVAAQNSAAGKKRFENLCAPCHGAGGAGGERAGPLFGREESRIHSVQDLRDTIRNGIPAAGMPPFHLPAAQFEDVVAYVHALRSPAAEHPAPGDASAGERFFFGNGNCGECHAVRGRGGWIGPDLSDVGSRRSLTEI